MPFSAIPTYLLVRAAGAALLGAAVIAYWRRPRALRIVTVIDGDTLIAVNAAGKKYKLRVRGIDCPELGQRLSYEARDFAQTLVQGKWVQVRFHGRDKFRRHVASVRIGNTDLAREMIAHGFGFPLSRRLKWASLGARLLRRGVWGGFGQAKPWESNSRASGLSRLFNRSKGWRTMRRKQKEARHQRKKR